MKSTLDIAKNITINGIAGKVILDGGNTFTNGSSNNDGVRMMSINSGKTVTLSNLTFQNGYAKENGGGAIYINSGCSLTVNDSTFNRNTAIRVSSGTCGGGAIWNNSGTLTVNDSTFNDNTTNKTGGAINSWGGTLTVNNSTFSGNSANTGGAIHSVARTNVNDSTFNNNRATACGGAIYNDYSGEKRILTVTNSTFSNNSAGTDGGAIYNNPNSDVNLINNIILGNGNQQISGTLTLDKYNITTDYITDIFETVEDGRAVLDADGTFHIKNNGAAAWSGTKLQNNGDNLQYWDKETNDWANAGVTTTLTTAQLQVDRFGNNRTTGTAATAGLYTVGAYFVEIEQEIKSLVVTTDDDVENPYDGVISLREAIKYAGTDGLGNDITFNATAFATAQTIWLNSTLDIAKNITINGITGKVILDGRNSMQIMNIVAGKTVTLSNLTFQHGFAVNGGAIRNESSLLTINGAKFISNEATFGGAIYNIAGTVTVNQSLFRENRAYSNTEITSGGAIVSIPNDTTSGTLVVNSSTFSGNTANSETSDAYAGAIGSAGSLTVINSTFSNNTAKTAGGAISVNDENNGTVLVNSILIGNRKSSDDSSDDVSIGVGSASAYFCLLGNISSSLPGPDNTYSLSVGDVFCTLDGDRRAVLNADGTFHLKPQAHGSNKGCKLQSAGGNLQYWRNDTNSWENVYLNPLTMETPIQTALTTAELQTDQLGNNRTEHLVTPDAYSVGAVVLTDTASTIVTTQEDVVNPFDGLISLREAVEKYAQNNDTITFSSCSNIKLDSEITVNKNIIIGGDITLSTNDNDSVLFKAANGTEKITIGGVIKIEKGDISFGGGTIAINSGERLIINNNSTFECDSFQNNGMLNVAGALNVVNSSAVVYTGNWGEVEYSSSSGQTVNAGTYSKLTLSGSGTKTLADETTADTVAVNGAENKLITLEGNNKLLSVTTLSASWATIQNVNFAANTTLDSWNSVIQSNTVDGSGNTNLTINLGGTFSGTVSNELTYGETLKDNANIKLIYSLRRQNAELAVSADDSTIYNKGTHTQATTVSAAGYTFENSTTLLLSLDFTVNSKTVSVDWVKDSSYTYTGSDQGETVSASYKDIDGIDQGLTVAFTGTSGIFLNAGNYTATASTINDNYILDSDSASIQLVISQKMLTVATTTQTITYGESPDLTNYTVSGWIGSEVEYLGCMSVTGTTSSSGFLTAGTPHKFDGSALISPSRNYSINFVTADVTVNHKQVTGTYGIVTTSKVYDGTRTAVSRGNTVSGLLTGDKVSLNSAFLYNSANVTEATTISAAWTLNGLDAANYILSVDFVPVSGSITAKTVDVIWADLAPYYVIGENLDQGGTISAKFVDVGGSNVSLGIHFLHETAGETKFAQSGNYVAVAEPSSDRNYILSESTASKAYSIGVKPNNPAHVDDAVQLWGLNPNFDSTVPALLGHALATGTTTSRIEGNIYTAPYSTMIHSTDLLEHERETPNFSGLPEASQFYVSWQFVCQGPSELISYIDGVVRLNRPSLVSSIRLSTSVSGGTNIVNVSGLASGIEFTIVRSYHDVQDHASDGIDITYRNDIDAEPIMIMADNNDNKGFDFLPQPLKMPELFFQKREILETTVLPPEYDFSGLPPVEQPHKIGHFKSKLEHMIDEILVTA